MKLLTTIPLACYGLAFLATSVSANNGLLPPWLLSEGDDERNLNGLLNYGDPACPDYDGGLCDSQDKAKYIVCFEGSIVRSPRTVCSSSNFYWNLLLDLGLARCGCCTEEEDPNLPSYCKSTSTCPTAPLCFGVASGAAAAAEDGSTPAESESAPLVSDATSNNPVKTMINVPGGIRA